MLRCAMRWSAIHMLMTGLIGKSMFILSLAVPISKLAQIGINLPSFSISTLGAVLISICHILSRIFIPDIIADFKSYQDYISRLLYRNKYCMLDLVDEFCILDKVKEFPICLQDNVSHINKFLPVDEHFKLLSPGNAIYKYGVAKYTYIDHSKPYIRLSLTSLFLIGIIFVYYPSIHAIFILITNLF